MRLAWLLALTLYSTPVAASSNKPYWVHYENEYACSALKDFQDASRMQGPLITEKEKARAERSYFGTGKCIRVGRDQVIEWDEKELPTNTGNAIPAKVKLLGKDGDWYMAARSLRRQSWADLEHEEFRAARGILACASKSSLADGYKALSLEDIDWLERLGCIFVATGWRVVRLDPVLGYWGRDWRVRVYAPSGKGATAYVWITEGDLTPAFNDKTSP